MNLTVGSHRSILLSFILLVISLLSACATPTAQETNTPEDIENTRTATDEVNVTADDTWQTYRNENYNFQFRYPSQGQVAEGLEGRSARIDLAFTPGTNLGEKFVQIDIQENPAECSSPLSQGYAPEVLQQSQETINGIEFQTTSGSEGAAGSIYDWEAYTTTRDGTCISISFVLRATNPNNYTTPLPEYNKARESAVFPEILSTFQFTD